jgi:hypothetical protein
MSALLVTLWLADLVLPSPSPSARCPITTRPLAVSDGIRAPRRGELVGSLDALRVVHESYGYGNETLAHASEVDLGGGFFAVTTQITGYATAFLVVLRAAPGGLCVIDLDEFGGGGSASMTVRDRWSNGGLVLFVVESVGGIKHSGDTYTVYWVLASDGKSVWRASGELTAEEEARPRLRARGDSVELVRAPRHGPKRVVPLDRRALRFE